MSKELKYKTICPPCGKALDSRNGERIPDGKVVSRECFDTYNADKQLKVEKSKNKQYPEFVPKDWTECYKLPLHLSDYGVFAFGIDNGRVLEFFYHKNVVSPREMERSKHIIDIINGVCLSDFEPEWKLSDDVPCRITYKGETQFSVRGWWYLIGRGGLNLPVKLASDIQNGFINYIINQLNGNKNETKAYRVYLYKDNSIKTAEFDGDGISDTIKRKVQVFSDFNGDVGLTAIGDTEEEALTSIRTELERNVNNASVAIEKWNASIYAVSSKLKEVNGK